MQNVLLITIDAFRHDHIGFMGYARDTTPFLNSLAQQGCYFTHAYANSCWTAASFPSILSSQYPVFGQEYGIKNKLTVQQVLTNHGYQTIAFHSNPHLSRYFGYDKWFHSFNDYFDKQVKHTSHPKQGVAHRLFEIAQGVPCISPTLNWIRSTRNTLYPLTMTPGEHYIDASVLTDDVIAGIGSYFKSPWFLWIHYMDPHGPPGYPQIKEKIQGQVKRQQLQARLSGNVPQKQLRLWYLKELIKRYDSRIRYVDSAIQRLFAYLQSLDMTCKTLVIITADHGEEFYDHGELLHKPKLYEELIHVPLLMKGPDVPANKSFSKLVQHIDIAPTILESLGIAVPSSFLGENLLKASDREGVISEVANDEKIQQGLNGISFNIEGGNLSNNDASMIPKINLQKLKIAYTTMEWKYIFSANADDEMYNLKSDPCEQHNLVSREPYIAEKLLQNIFRHLDEKQGYYRTSAQKNRLRARIRKEKGLHNL